MIELLKILLSLSLSGTLLIFILLLCKPLYKNRLSRQWQYYIWLVVIARLLLPFTLETSLVGNLFRGVDSSIVNTSELTDSHLSPKTNFVEYDTSLKIKSTIKESPKLEKTLFQKVLEMLIQNIWLICILVWLMVAVGLLIRKITIYQSFVKYINAGCMEVTDMHLWEQLGKLVEQTGVKRTVELYTNGIISSPLLIGFLHPCVMLPSTELSDSDFKNTILHELTHYKRHDMFYKWLVQVTICLHWFNPFVYLMVKEINRACEFSCDEAVIKTFDKEEQREYGDTLLNAIETRGNYNNSLGTVMFNENAELLKERLEAIMRFKKSTRLTKVISVVLAFTLCFGATVAGAYGNPKQLSKDDINVKDSVTIADNNTVENSNKKLIDISSVESFRVTAGLGPEQTSDYSQLKQTDFIFSQGQKVQIYVDFISAFHTTTSGHSVKLIFADSQQHTVELILNEGEREEIIFENSGVYSISIQNDENVSLSYSFILQEAKVVNPEADYYNIPVSAQPNDTIQPYISSSTGEIPVTIEKMEINYYEDKNSNDRWPYIHWILNNNSDKTISDYEMVCLAYNKDGEPLELIWKQFALTDGDKITGFTSQSDKSYKQIITLSDKPILPNSKEDLNGGWSLWYGWNQAKGTHIVEYVLACMKQVTYDDGTIWLNPTYDHWLKEYQGKFVSTNILENYYN